MRRRQFREPFSFILSNATGGASIGDGQGIGTIYASGGGNPCPLC